MERGTQGTDEGGDLVTEAAALLERLARNDPWSHSTEGIDDCCVHCGCWDSTYDGHVTHCWHHADCPWFAAVVLLGLAEIHPAHHRRRY